MSTSGRKTKQSVKGHRPRAATVFAAAFIAGAAAAFGVNRALDVHLAQSKPKVESEPIFVALRSLPQGAPVTVWDVALRDWPKAMMPAAAMRPNDSFDGSILKHPLREGQPLLAVQLAKAPTTNDSQMVEAAPVAAPAAAPAPAIPQPDLWAPGEDPAAPTASATPVATPAEPAPTAVAAATAVTAAPSAETSHGTNGPSQEAIASVQPQETAVAAATTGEPTVAADAAVDPVQQVAEPEAVSVVQPATEAEAASPAASSELTTMTPPPSPTVRYLVVPERIAQQADRSFVQAAPQATQQPGVQPAPQAQASTQPDPQHAKPQTAPQSKPQQPQVATQPPPVREAPQSSQQRTRTARQPRSTPEQPAAQRSNTSAFQSMFPNLSAGMTAVEQQLEKIRRERESGGEASAQPAAGRQPNQSGQPGQSPQQQQQQRSAYRPFFRQ